MKKPKIKAPHEKIRLVTELGEGADITVKFKNSESLPNRDCIVAMQELKTGKGVKFESVDELFDGI